MSSAFCPVSSNSAPNSVVNFLKYVVTEVLFSIVALRHWLSQGSVATHFKCRDIFSDSIVANFLLILTMKKVRKLVNIWWSYKAYKNVPIFRPPCTYCRSYNLLIEINYITSFTIINELINDKEARYGIEPCVCVCVGACACVRVCVRVELRQDRLPIDLPAILIQYSSAYALKLVKPAVSGRGTAVTTDPKVSRKFRYKVLRHWPTALLHILYTVSTRRIPGFLVFICSSTHYVQF